MNHAVGPGAETWLMGRGGLRARVLGDGRLRLGATELVLLGKTLQPGNATGFIGKRPLELRLEGGV